MSHDTRSIERLWYAGGVRASSGDDRTLHVDRDCQYLKRANSRSSCSVDNRPRGSLCTFCTPDWFTLDGTVATDGGPDLESVCDHDDKCAACGVTERATGSRYCEDCRRELDPDSVPGHDVEAPSSDLELADLLEYCPGCGRDELVVEQRQYVVEVFCDSCGAETTCTTDVFFLVEQSLLKALTDESRQATGVSHE